MNHALSIFAIGVFAAVALGIADFFGARASKDIGPITAAFFVQVVGTVAFCVWYLGSGTGMPDIPATTWAYAIAGALLMGAGMCTLYLAFEIGPVSLASPLSAAYPLVTAAVGVMFFHAALSVAECVAVVVIVLGIMAASGLLGVERAERTISVGPRMALLTTLFWGLAYPLLGRAIETAGWEAITLIQLTAMVPVLGAMLIARRTQERVTSTLVAQSLRSPVVYAAGVLQMLAVLAINIGFGLDQAAGTMVVATSAAYPVITMLLALRHFDEHADRLALAGAGLTVAGVLALHTF
ncbi:DMT family transporter [Mycolicibacterium sp. S2-37]|uniref:DMT family transporter n=1 Tax=Mycolicibacterium sp. S2-37 TaxID=2810297 RepID=UPI001A94D7A0|nr:EamA family transporter [Mycolicibacterium sp. S2-37]MBO0678123.1 DMT family transporter [Mycolicibacterium sp. S2-37]